MLNRIIRYTYEMNESVFDVLIRLGKICLFYYIYL